MVSREGRRFLLRKSLIKATDSVQKLKSSQLLSVGRLTYKYLKSVQTLDFTWKTEYRE